MQPVILRNATCIYCGADLTSTGRTEEHVIARRFVPKGSLEATWNVKAFACATCNNRKSGLEDDISAISMQPDQFGDHAVPDPRLAQEYTRKAANSHSRRTRRPVAQSQEDLSVTVPVNSGALQFTATSGAQASWERIAALARMQIGGFFYFLTFDNATLRGGFWPGSFYYLDSALRSDWGNPVQKWFASTSATQDHRLVAKTAAGYFRVAIRRVRNHECWTWAVEWNCNLRVVGFLGDGEAVSAFAESLPHRNGGWLPQPDGSYVRVRQEVTLDATDDVLFALPEAAA